MNTTAAIQPEVSLCDGVQRLQHEFLSGAAASAQKTKGQFFTPIPVARFMASLLPLPKHTIRVLDPGAGAGILTSAFCERILNEDLPRTIHADLFETDANVLPLLTKTMEDCRKALSSAGHSLNYRIHAEDFVLTMAPDPGSLFEDKRDQYNCVITNPPYFKINRESAYAHAMPEVVHGQPNIYAIFLAVAASLLEPDGAMAAITPRSFCNGLYFRKFRRWFLEHMSLDHIHVFRSRQDTFREAKVLQESIITLATRGKILSNQTIISRSSDREFNALSQQVVPSSQVVCQRTSDRTIFVPETDEDAQIVQYAQSWSNSFEGQGLRISTGPVVMFRAQDHLRHDAGQGVPLLSAHNIHRFATHWPKTKAKWPLAFADTPSSRKYLVPTANYVLLKRFSAKEERRRLTAGCLIKDETPHERVAIENHLNYIYHTQRELTVDETWGVAAIFNSALYDRYFRSLSGNTQVNATEVRSLAFPDLKKAACIGARVRAISDGTATAVEQVVLEVLAIPPSLRAYLTANTL